MGRFFLPDEAINAAPFQVKQLMGKCIILSVDVRYDIRCLEYFAISDLFEHVEEGEEAPAYRVDKIGDGQYAARKLEPYRGYGRSFEVVLKEVSEAAEEAREKALAAELELIASNRFPAP